METYRGARRSDSSAPSVNRNEPQLHHAPASGPNLLCCSTHSINVLFPPDYKVSKVSKQEVSYRD